MKVKGSDQGDNNQGQPKDESTATGENKTPVANAESFMAEEQKEQVVPKEHYDALVNRLEEQERKFEMVLEKFNNFQTAVSQQQQVVYQSPVIQSELERLKAQYQEQYEKATLLPEEEQVVYYCYLWAYPAMGYLHDKTRKFVNPPFLNSNYKYQPIEFKFASTQKFHDPIDGERPVPYSIFRATYIEEVEFLENHPAFGNLFYRFNGNKIKQDDLRMASLRASITTQVNGMSPNALGQTCMREGVSFDPLKIGESRKLLIEAMFKKQSQTIDNSEHENIVSMFAGAKKTINHDGQKVPVADMSGLPNLLPTYS